MLKRFMIKRFLIVVAILLVLLAGLAVPLKREYSFIKDAQSGTTNQLTEVHYGVPLTWLTLSKEVDAADSAQVKKSYSERDNTKLVGDLGFWIIIIAACAYISRITNIKLPIKTWP
jgi:hypothetical protein